MPHVLARLVLLLPLMLGLPAAMADIDREAYGYPLTNPFEATIATTPPPLRPPLPDDEDIRQKDYSLNLQPQRESKLPANFWPVKRLHYRLARQPGEAPLIFIIAGTGSHYANSTMEQLKKLFYGAGFHVVQLSSPTSYDFIAGASRHATPGYSPEDAKDLYRVMEAIREQQDDLPVSRYYLTGYSLGGMQAAFVSQLDEQRKVFDFAKVLMINPPVNLYASVGNLDRLVQTRVQGVDDHRTFYELIFHKLTLYVQNKGRFDMNEAMLYDFQQSRQRLSDEQLAMLIGSSFRFSAADIAFTSDLINRRGLITPPDTRIRDRSSLTEYFKRSLLCDFQCYMEQQLVPFWKKHYNGQDFQQLVQQTSLYALQDYLRDNPRIAAMHNADDIILSPGELGFLRQTLGPRLTVYPLGGHCGNMNYRVNTDAILEYFRG